MPGELKILRYFAFGFLVTPFLALIFRSGPDYSFIENLRIGFLSLIVSCPFFIGFGGFVYLFNSKFRLQGLFVFLSSLIFFGFLVYILLPVFSSLHHPTQQSTQHSDYNFRLHFRGDNNRIYSIAPFDLPDFFEEAHDAGVRMTYVYFSESNNEVSDESSSD